MHDFYFRETDRIAVLHADLLCIDYQGSILDACCLALLAALMDLRIPSISLKEEELVLDYGIFSRFDVIGRSLPAGDST